ncbi:MAG: diguanylate cyclase, partial [Bacteroidetes bacterium]|nr:diguanylate cyclase [Bacteroidota bacterium]
KKDALSHTARVIFRIIRQSDILCRMGKEDLFCLLCVLESHEHAEDIINRIKERVKKDPLYSRDQPTEISIDIGHFVSTSKNLEESLKKAKEQLGVLNDN